MTTITTNETNERTENMNNDDNDDLNNEERCPDCGSTEAGNCFYCKQD